MEVAHPATTREESHRSSSVRIHYDDPDEHEQLEQEQGAAAAYDDGHRGPHAVGQRKNSRPEERKATQQQQQQSIASSTMTSRTIQPYASATQLHQHQQSSSATPLNQSPVLPIRTTFGVNAAYPPNASPKPIDGGKPAAAAAAGGGAVVAAGNSWVPAKLEEPPTLSRAKSLLAPVGILDVVPSAPLLLEKRKYSGSRGGAGGGAGHALDGDDEATSEHSGSEDDHSPKKRRQRWALRILGVLFVCGMILAALLIGFAVYRNLRRNELDSFRDTLQLLCTERTSLFKRIMGQSVSSMQGAAGFGRMSLRALDIGVVQAPIVDPYKILGNGGFFQDAEARVYGENATIVKSSFRMSDFQGQ
jgi:hypothetical protein